MTGLQSVRPFREEKEDAVFSDKLYGLIIALLTLAITVVVAMREKEGLRIELVIEPARQALPVRGSEKKHRDRLDTGPNTQIAARRQSVIE